MTVWILARRNLRIFFRDRAGVFFSLLSALILMGLYALFLGGLQVDNLQTRFPAASAATVHAFVDAWVFAGITMITTVTTGLAALSVFVEDSASGRFKDFLVSPIRRSSVIFGYMLSSFIVALVMTTVVVAAAQGYTALRGNAVMAPADLVRTAGFVVISAATFAAISGCVVTFLRSNGAFAALSTIVGTVIGFLAGAYIPAGTLPSGVVTVMNSLPFAQSAMLLRQPFTAQAAAALTGGVPEASTALDTFYGIAISVGDITISNAMALGELVLLLLVFSVLSSYRLARRIRSVKGS
ncbi:ABC transporter permease [Rathayibacter toxicus]|uniref:ABC transporter permease n=1 Tax=Rathayibacter toxicus TaxID=145458 RepID=A0A0C5BA29_9MICO|nr:ABC transporter permease [Rathayibacter toxicus]AJM77743.1 ABC transporter permease [Rathayibacter toxicus]ALS58090.1 ABC transporter permease [Rathayibacter toxicus]KKM45300.1 ABC transporter permease [Rathayibacter toxicus]PPG21878.1 ABC transporter permease [Rathayibacter toxicus]PPG46840.1 ABC transporter permease [Rathayibacter toxicus]